MLGRNNNLTQCARSGDWLVDGMNHFEEEHGGNAKHAGTGLYEAAERILDINYNELARFKRMAKMFEFRQRCLNLTFAHHYEVASLKKTSRPDAGRSI